MPGERELLGRGEDPHGVVGLLARRREQERRLRQVRPGREALHLLAGEALAVDDDRHGVAEQRLLREDVDLGEAPAHHASIAFAPVIHVTAAGMTRAGHR